MRILLLTLSLATAISAMAQASTQEQAFQERARQATEQLTGKLVLDQDQINELDRMHFAYFRELEYIQTQMPEEYREGRLTAIDDMREQTYRAVLTGEQYGQLRELREKQELH